MYALLQIRDKQYKVKEGSIVLVPGWTEVKPGEIKVLMVKNDQTVIGTPVVDGAQVDFEPLRQIKTKKINVWKFKAKVNYHRKKSHRVQYTIVRIKNIKIPALEG